MAKKLSKFFRAAVEGATTDGRIIERLWLTQMAKNFDPTKYGARIWLEHLRGTLPDSPFKAYGDVAAVKTEEIEMDGAKKLALFVQIEPTDDLIALSKSKQKIYTSLEISHKFADTGEAYLVGLGITDSPASLGTEVLTFAASNPTANPFAGRKSSPENLFSEAIETNLEFDEMAPPEKSLSEKVKSLLNKFTDKKTGDESRFNDMTEALETLITHINTRDEQFSKTTARIEQLEEKLANSGQAFNTLKEQLEKEDSKQPHRHTATGGSSEKQTDC